MYVCEKKNLKSKGITILLLETDFELSPSVELSLSSHLNKFWFSVYTITLKPGKNQPLVLHFASYRGLFLHDLYVCLVI